jgi:hypothetical protein
MATKRVVFWITVKLLSPSFITITLLMAISVNSRIVIAQSDFPNEIDYYEGISGVSLESAFPWPEFKNLDGYYLRVSRQGLRRQSIKVLDTLGVCRIFVDTRRGVIWMSGFTNVQMDEPRLFIYYWIAPSGGTPPTSNGSPLIEEF